MQSRNFLGDGRVLSASIVCLGMPTERIVFMTFTGKGNSLNHNFTRCVTLFKHDMNVEKMVLGVRLIKWRLLMKRNLMFSV